MRLKIGDYEFEGTPIELAAVKLSLDQAAADAALAQQSRKTQGSKVFVSEDVAFDVLTRRPLADSYRIILKVLHAAGDSWTMATELQKRLKYSKSEFAGLMGAFGRRLSYSDGVQDGDQFFDNEWNDELGCNRYRLPQNIRSAVAKAGLA